MRLKSLFLACLVTLVFAIPAFAATFNLGAVTGSVSTQVTVPITLTNAGASIAALSIDIGFDSTKLSLSAVESGPAITVKDVNGDPIKTIAQNLLSSGVLRLGIYGGTYDQSNNLAKVNNLAIGNGIVAYVKFNILANASGTLTLTNTPGASDPAGTPIVITGASGQINIPTLTLAFNGTGSGSVHSTPSGIACTSGISCPPANFILGTDVTLSKTPSEGSTFNAWSVVPPCTLDVNNDCIVTMDGPKNITATFNVKQLSRIERIPETYYGMLAHAFAAVPDNSTDTIDARDVTFIENLILNRAITASLKGGFNSGFSSNTGGFTYLDGKLTVNAGKLTVQGLKIK